MLPGAGCEWIANPVDEPTRQKVYKGGKLLNQNHLDPINLGEQEHQS
jgi:hypothetical protein